MAGIFIAPLLSGATEVLTSIGVELGLSSGVSEVIGGTVVGEVSNQIGNQIISTKSVQDTLNNLIATSTAVLGQDAGFFIGGSSGGGSGQIRTNLDQNNTQNNAPSTKDISKFIVRISNALALQAFNGEPLNENVIIKDIVKDNESMSEVAKSIGSFLASKIPNNDEYKRVAEVYNGKNLNVSSNISAVMNNATKKLDFTLIDEVGDKFILPQNPGFVVPAIYDTFVGLNSQNDKLPETLVGLYAAFHDYSYFAGNYRIGDYKLISRCSQNFSRMTEDEKPYARLCIVYFSTVGHLVSNFIDKDKTYETPSFSNQVIIGQTPDSFEQQLIKDLEIESLQNSVMAVYNSSNHTNKMLYSEFSKLMVELL